MLKWKSISTGVEPTGLDSIQALLIQPRTLTFRFRVYNLIKPLDFKRARHTKRSVRVNDPIHPNHSTRPNHLRTRKQQRPTHYKDALLQNPLLHGKSKNHGKQTLRLGPREDPKRRLYRLIIISTNININTGIKQAVRPVILLGYSSESYSYYYYYERRHLVSRPERATLNRRTHQT